MKRPLTALATALLMVGVALSAQPAAVALDDPFVVYLAPSGDDTNTGLSPTDPVKTLARAHSVLVAEDPQSNVEVRIAPGTYRLPSSEIGSTTWSFYVPGHTVTFAPTGYTIGDTTWSNRPVFEGDRIKPDQTTTNGTNSWWFAFSLPPSDTGGTTGLQFYFLDVRHFVNGGISVNGGVDYTGIFTEPSGAGANGNLFYGMRFYEIGSLYNTSGSNLGYGAIDVINSSDNSFQSNEFIRQENKVHTDVGGETLDLRPNIHGVYLAHFSTSNLVQDNEFDTVSGDPVNIRDASNDNYISGNTFTNAGHNGFYNEWFCTSDVSGSCSPQECTSHGNEFRNNTLVSGYAGYGTPVDIPAFDFHWPKDSEATPAEQVAAQRPGCYPGTMAPRLATSGNVRP